MRAPLRVGIAGAGFISDYHITGLQAAGAEVVCVASRTLERAEAKARRYAIAEATDDVEEMLRRADLDLVVIATPDATHEALALVAIEANRPVLLQKPMARTAAAAERIRAAAEHLGTPLFVSFMHRYFEEVVEVKKLLSQRALGRVLTIRQRNATPGADWAAWFYDAALSGGVVAQLGVHGIDLLRYLFGEIEAVLAVEETAHGTRQLIDGSSVRVDIADTAIALYRFATGPIASHEMSYREVAGTDRFRLEVYGEEGTAWLRTERGRLAYALASDGAADWRILAGADGEFGLRQHAHVLAMVRGEAPNDGSARDGVRAMRIVEAIETSARVARWTAVAP
jgi:predicted dehydrogenase